MSGNVYGVPWNQLDPWSRASEDTSWIVSVVRRTVSHRFLRWKGMEMVVAISSPRVFLRGLWVPRTRPGSSLDKHYGSSFYLHQDVEASHLTFMYNGCATMYAPVRHPEQRTMHQKPSIHPYLFFSHLCPNPQCFESLLPKAMILSRGGVPPNCCTSTIGP